MPEEVKFDSAETLLSANYIEIGKVPDTGKHAHIGELFEMGLHVPPTLVCDYQSLQTDTVQDWLKNQFKENDLQIRTTTDDENRNSPSMRDPSGTFDDFLVELDRFSKENILMTFLLQGTPKDSINRDILSGNIMKDRNKIVADLWPDLASWGNRMNRSALWRYSVLFDGGSNLQTITTKDIADRLWRDILYRRGRRFIKEDKTKKAPPKIEEASPDEPYYNEAIEYAKAKFNNGSYPLDIVKYFYDCLKDGGNILEQFPNRYISSLDRDMRRLLENPKFNEQSIAKFSLLLTEKDQVIKAEPIYWDLIPQHQR
jgi:hypothetical protein